MKKSFMILNTNDFSRIQTHFRLGGGFKNLHRLFTKWAAFFFIYVFPLLLSAQTPKIDSLKNVLPRLNEDTSKVNTYIELSFELRTIDSHATIRYATAGSRLADSIQFWRGKARSIRNIGLGHNYLGNPDSALYYCRIAEEIAKSNGFLQIQADVYNTMGNTYFRKSLYDSARWCFERSLDIFTKIKNEESMALSRASIAVTYSEQGKYSKAVEIYQETLLLFEKWNNPSMMANLYNNIANIYLERDDYEKAYEFYLKTSEYDSITGNKAGRAYTLLNIGNILVHLERNQEAKGSYKLAIELALSSGSECTSTLPMTQLGDLFLKEEFYDSAYYYISNALALAERCQNERSKASVYLDLGEYYRLQGDLISAKASLIKGFEAAERNELKPNMAELSESLYKIYELEGNFIASYKYLKIFHELKKELFNKENTQKITRLEAEYEFEKEKQFIALEQEKRELQYQKELTRKQWINYSVGIAAFFLAVTAFIAYRSYRRKQAHNSLLEERNENLRTLRAREQQLSEEALAAKERELATMAMSSHEKNSLLHDLEQKVTFLENRLDDDVKRELKEMRKTISESYSLDKSWDSFLHKFEDVYPQFFDKLKEENPNLTVNDLKLSAYLKIGMTNKEIANVTHLTLGSVKSSINRLKKKLKMEPEESIRDFVLKYA